MFNDIVVINYTRCCTHTDSKNIDNIVSFKSTIKQVIIYKQKV